MENKINVAELLRDCPKGMELDCTMFDDVTFVRVDNNREQFPIEITVGGLRSKYLTKEGCFHDNMLITEAKCVIFPKGKTTWEGFQRPFKDGDVVMIKSLNALTRSIAIFKNEDFKKLYFYNTKELSGKVFSLNKGFFKLRLATEEEKQKLFDAIKDNGYRWNGETKTLEKLPKFKVGDIVQDKNGYKVRITDVGIEEECYAYESLTVNGIGGISFNRQDDWELVPNKFDISTLKPFDKVLVRGNVGQKWIIDFFGFVDNDKGYPFVCVAHYVIQCIPYEDNEHLLGTTNDCADFYKTW